MYGHQELINSLPSHIATELDTFITTPPIAESLTHTPSPIARPTAILTHPYCRMHYTCAPSATQDPSAPPENFRRLNVLIDEQHGALRARDIETNVTFVEECRKAVLGDVLRVHEWSYVRRLQALCQGKASGRFLSSYLAWLSVRVPTISLL